MTCDTWDTRSSCPMSVFAYEHVNSSDQQKLSHNEHNHKAFHPCDSLNDLAAATA